jgi:hypothetical protein
MNTKPKTPPKNPPILCAKCDKRLTIRMAEVKQSFVWEAGKYFCFDCRIEAGEEEK